MKTGTRAGFTIIELMIALAILTLVMVNVSMVTRTTSEAYKAGVFITTMEEQANQTMERMTLAIMSSSADAIEPVPVPPLNSSSIEYEVSLGIEDGELVLGDPERIEFVPGSGQVIWSQNPELPEERSVVWSRWVPDSLEDEIPNGLDDNGNGLVDESGLSFDMDGDLVTIRLTIEKDDPSGVTRNTSKEGKVTCRN